MSGITDMKDEVELLSASSRLQTVATGLKKLIDKELLENTERDELTRLGELFGQIDWDSEHHKRNEHPELSVIATQLRPTFYRKLTELKVPFDKDYSERVYQTLKSAGRKISLSPHELVQVQQVFQLMSYEILSGLQYTHMMSDPD